MVAELNIGTEPQDSVQIHTQLLQEAVQTISEESSEHQTHTIFAQNYKTQQQKVFMDIPYVQSTGKRITWQEQQTITHKNNHVLIKDLAFCKYCIAEDTSKEELPNNET